MRAARGKPYRRSWKNLLLNKRYQLGFTLSMVGLSSVLMAFLGYWVVHEAKRATYVAISNVEGQRCPAMPEMPPEERARVIIDEITEMTPPTPTPAADSASSAADPTDPGATGDSDPGATGDSDPDATGDSDPGTTDHQAAAGDANATGEATERRRPRVTLDEGTIRLEAPAAADVAMEANFVEEVVQNYRCRHGKIAKIAKIENGYRVILGVLVGVGIFMLLGLTVWGIKMTHHLAGPLYKVGLYFAKMQEGRFDEVYNLRKGDQLVEFYEQFKAAHHGLKDMQRDDIEKLRAVIEVADAEELSARSPELAAVLDELRETLARKEKSLE